MPELGPYGSVRGAAGNSRPYRERGGANLRCPLYPRKRTFLGMSTMSAKCHNGTNGTEAKNWVKGTRDYRRASRIRRERVVKKRLLKY
jgi:hypothetical protein